MDAFWKWMQGLNVRMIAALTVLVLILVIVWSLWKGYSTAPQTVASTVPDTTSGTNPVAGETSFPWTREFGLPGAFDRNPFSSPILEAFLAQEERDRLAAEKAAAEAAAAEAARLAAEHAAAKVAASEQAAEAAATPPAAAPEPPLPTERNVTLLYRGMMIRPDGVALALIENQTDKITAFHKLEDRLAGVRVADISRKTLRVILGEGATAEMTVNEPKTFVEALSNAQ